MSERQATRTSVLGSFEFEPDRLSQADEVYCMFMRVALVGYPISLRAI